MNYADYEQDLVSMKECNVNSIRMSHYPPDPTFIMMCEHYGMYVIDEADIETHGMTYGLGINPINHVSHNKKWTKHYWDRVYRMFARDKNSVAVVMWSLGNEAGGFNCQDYCYKELKTLTSTPIHYEAVIRTRRFAYDVISEMYTYTDKIEKYVAGKLPEKFYKKPFMLCEYAHAMGVGPGDLEKYWELIYMKDSFAGAFVWEWKDHAILHDANSNMPASKYKYTYGGDHEEVMHDSNFCVDGLLYPDGSFHTGAKCLKAVYSPIRSYKEDNNDIKIINRYGFLDTSGVDITWAHYIGGEAKNSGTICEIISAGDSYTFTPDIMMADTSDNYIVMTYTDKATGNMISRDNIMINEFIPNINTCASAKIINNGGNLSLSLVTGLINTYKVDGVQLLAKTNRDVSEQKSFVGTIYRACIDNYGTVKKKWLKRGLEKSTYELVKCEYNGDGRIKTIHNINVGKDILAQVDSTYIISECGSMTVNATLSTNSIKTIDLPKFGMAIDVNDSLANVEYYGLGDGENYSDMHEQSIMGIWSNNAADMYEDYIKPQDNGNRAQTRWMSMTDNDGVGLLFTAVEKPFNFTILPVSLDVLSKAKHQEDITPSGMHNVNIDAFVRGIGSNSCGPDTRDDNKHVLSKTNPISYSFHVRPLVAKNKREQ